MPSISPQPYSRLEAFKVDKVEVEPFYTLDEGLDATCQGLQRFRGEAGQTPDRKAAPEISEEAYKKEAMPAFRKGNVALAVALLACRDEAGELDAAQIEALTTSDVYQELDACNERLGDALSKSPWVEQPHSISDVELVPTSFPVFPAPGSAVREPWRSEA